MAIDPVDNVPPQFIAGQQSLVDGTVEFFDRVRRDRRLGNAIPLPAMAEQAAGADDRADDSPRDTVEPQEAADRASTLHKMFRQQSQLIDRTIAELVATVRAISAENAVMRTENADLLRRLTEIQRHTILPVPRGDDQ